MLAWGAKVSSLFRRKVIAIAMDIGFDASWLMSYIAFETGETFSPSVKNPQSDATGLIQFLPSTAIGLGTTVEKLAAMTAEEQLDYVHDYFKPYKGRIQTFSDGYMAILRPTGIGKPEDFALISDPESKAYVQNKGLDLNKDGNITKAEAAAFPRAKLDKGLQPNFASTEDQQSSPEVTVNESKPDILSGIGAIASMLNPVAGIVFNAFSPIIKEKISKEVDRHSAQPGVGMAVANALSDALVGKAQELTGRTDPLEAAAVVIQPQNAAKLQQVEDTAVASVAERLKQLAPLLDKSIEYDKARWQAEREGRQDATDAAIKEKQAGLWDYTRALVYSTCAVMVSIAIGLLVLIGKQAWGGNDIDSGLIGLAGPIWMGTMAAAFMAMVMHRFDGSRNSSEQTRAMLDLAKSKEA
jgi:hypothetical protein